MYAERQRRQAEAATFAGSSDEFLRLCGTRVTIAHATEADVPRLHELSVRTHQFNTRGEAVAEAELRAAGRLRGSTGSATVRLSDRFGDDGLVGGSVTRAGRGDTWTVTLLMMSCRAMGRGVIEALLAWLAGAARGGATAAGRAVPGQPSATCRCGWRWPRRGFRAAIPVPRPASRSAVFGRPLPGPLPERCPDWVTPRTSGERVTEP